jgi:hypothetical protein
MLRPEKRRSGGARVFLVLVLLLLVAGGFGGWWFLRPLQCPAGFADCNGQRGDGCETALERDPASCGGCGLACAHVPGVGCVDGHCHVTACPSPGTKDCNGIETDGCETDVRSDLANCGECGNACVAEGAKSVGCVASKCEITCKPGLADCNGVGKDGCETSLLKDTKNCGRCGTACTSSPCVDGLCAPLVLVSGMHTKHLTAKAGGLYYWNEDGHRIERVSVAEKPVVVVSGVTDLTGLAIGGDRLIWATSGGVFGRAVGDNAATPDRLAGPTTGETPLVTAQTGFVSWALRAAPASSTAARKKETKHAAVPGERRRVLSAAFGARGKATSPSVECNEWPRTFAADDHDTYCCDETTVLASVSCEGAKCTHRDFNAGCPDGLAMDVDRVYFGQDVRILSVDRKSNALGVFVKRKRHPHGIVLAGGFLYWLEGEHPADIFRIAKDAATGTAPEALARHQNDLVALAADETAVYWVTLPSGGKGEAGGTIYMLPVGEKR